MRFVVEPLQKLGRRLGAGEGDLRAQRDSRDRDPAARILTQSPLRLIRIGKDVEPFTLGERKEPEHVA